MENKLILIAPTDRRSSNGGIIWECFCACGKSSYHEGSLVKKNIIRSCGCLRKSKDPEKSGFQRIYQDYKQNAKTRDLDFSLSFKEFYSLILNKCHYCGRSPRKFTRKGFTINANGIDRVNNELGYILKNCVPCCSICNMSKKNMKYQEFIQWLEDVSKFRITQRNTLMIDRMVDPVEVEYGVSDGSA